MLRPPPPPVYDELAGYRQPPPSSSSALLGKPVAGRAAFAAPEPAAPPPPSRALGSLPGGGDAQADPQQLRRKINSRERKRMQDLNLAMDALREVILPYSAAHCQSSPGRKLSKIATLLLARNYILLLGSSLHELRRILGDLSGGGGGGGGGGGPRLLLAAAAAAAAGGLPLFAAAPPSPVLLTPGTLGHHHPHPHHPHHHPSASKYLSVALEEPQPCSPVPLPGGASLCTCGLCKVPHLLPSGLGLAAVQAAPFSK